MAVDWEAEGLLEGLDGDAREARRDLLERLHADGIPLEELRRAAAEGRLVLVPVERVLAGDERYTAQEVSERTGLDPEFLTALWRALGLARPEPDDAAFTEHDIAAVENIKRAIDAGVPTDGLLELSRVTSQAMAGVAAAGGQVFARALMQPGDNERDLALRYADAAGDLMQVLMASTQHVLRLQQLEAVRRAAVDVTSASADGIREAQEVTVCFADLVGFTKLGERVAAEELGEVAGRLTEMATEIASPPVRLVKTIGDAAMLVSPDSDALLAATLDLCAAVEDEGRSFPSLHAGLARGLALTRAGDWYGRPVNLASRITDFARPGAVVAERQVRDHAEGDYRWSFAGKRKLKGIRGEAELYRVRREDA